MSCPIWYWHRGHRQLGTLGGGNHFVEIQAIEIAEEQQEVAEGLGAAGRAGCRDDPFRLTGSGGMVNQFCTPAFAKVMGQLGLGSADPRLIFAPLEHPQGQRYVNLMYSALNYAVVNRHLIAYGVREAFREVFGTKCELRTLYDLMHNYAWKEETSSGTKFVHRKGATRALPAQHPDNPRPYAATGHPALIPGSMGTASYIMVGQPGGEENFYSICHGAGRIRSRTATKRLVSVHEFSQSLKVGKEDEIVVNQHSWNLSLTNLPKPIRM